MANIGDRCGQTKLQILPRSSTTNSGGTKQEGRSSEHRSDTKWKQQTTVQAAGLEQLRLLNWQRRLLQHSKISCTAVVNFNNSNYETKVSGKIIATECNI